MAEGRSENNERIFANPLYFARYFYVPHPRRYLSFPIKRFRIAILWAAEWRNLSPSVIQPSVTRVSQTSRGSVPFAIRAKVQFALPSRPVLLARTVFGVSGGVEPRRPARGSLLTLGPPRIRLGHSTSMHFSLVLAINLLTTLATVSTLRPGLPQLSQRQHLLL